ncbi:Peptidyl-prolyl cis-trans isomerase CYP20-1, partial [Zea mays]
ACRKRSEERERRRTAGDDRGGRNQIPGGGDRWLRAAHRRRRACASLSPRPRWRWPTGRKEEDHRHRRRTWTRSRPRPSWTSRSTASLQAGSCWDCLGTPFLKQQRTSEHFAQVAQEAGRAPRGVRQGGERDGRRAQDRSRGPAHRRAQGQGRHSQQRPAASARRRRPS